MKFEIKSVWGRNSNTHHSPETAGNGGGYWQPCGGVVAQLPDGRTVLIECEDRSCGDYGTRIYGSIEVDGFCRSVATGSMIEPENDMEDAEWRSMSGVLGLDAENMFQAAVSAVRTVSIETERYFALWFKWGPKILKAATAPGAAKEDIDFFGDWCREFLRQEADGSYLIEGWKVSPVSRPVTQEEKDSADFVSVVEGETVYHKITGYSLSRCA